MVPSTMSAVDTVGLEYQVTHTELSPDETEHGQARGVDAPVEVGLVQPSVGESDHRERERLLATHIVGHGPAEAGV